MTSLRRPATLHFCVNEFLAHYAPDFATYDASLLTSPIRCKLSVMTGTLSPSRSRLSQNGSTSLGVVHVGKCSDPAQQGCIVRPGRRR